MRYFQTHRIEKYNLNGLKMFLRSSAFDCLHRLHYCRSGLLKCGKLDIHAETYWYARARVHGYVRVYDSLRVCDSVRDAAVCLYQSALIQGRVFSIFHPVNC